MERIATDTYSFADIRDGGFVQAGYLTITGSLREGVYTQYTLGFLNDEVRHAFSKAVSQSAFPTTPESLP